MHAASLTAQDAIAGLAGVTENPAHAARCGSHLALAQALRASRADTLATFAALASALPDLRVPLHADLNPPLWELGHIGWFQEYWLGRFSARGHGAAADPQAPRLAPARANADALYDSSQVPHDSRWSLTLPDANATRDDLARQLEQTLALLLGGDASASAAAPALAPAGSPANSPANSPEDAPATTETQDDTLYFFRLALLHEDMHHEAALYSARALGVALEDARWQARPLPSPTPALYLVAGTWPLGGAPGPGFAFDNELHGHALALPAGEIDSQVLRWAEYLPFVEAAGYANPRFWTDAGRRWLATPCADWPHNAPRYLRRATGLAGTGWQQWRGGQWLPLDMSQPACHLTFHEAQAWCRWAGRRLPSEAEWERAALSHPRQPAQPGGFRWGDVWEWTASPFAPYPGFVAHPYRDYSAPWFDGRPVLRGASHLTQPRMRHPRYRNFFTASRNDIAAGFRSCAL